MNSSDVLAQIEAMGELPILPKTLLDIQRVATDDRSSAEDLARVILRDQALTLRVLRMVNSAMYQRRTREKVRTVRRAVIVLGFETVRKLALGLSVFDMMSKLSRSPQLIEVARHSLIAGVFAQRLAEASGRVAPEEAFVTALVHDVGKIVLLECCPREYDAVLAETAAGRDTIESERAHFGMSHDRAGRRLAREWKLPADLQMVIGEHHDFDPLHPPSKMDPRLAVIVYADAMSHFEGRRESAAHELRLVHRAGRVLGIGPSRIEEVYADIDQEIGELARDLDLAVGDLREYGVLVNADGSTMVAPPLSPEELAERTARQLELYRSVGRGVARGTELEILLSEILDGITQILGFERVVFFRVDDQARLLEPMMWRGDATIGTWAIGFDEAGALGLCAQQGRAFHVPAAQSDAYGDQGGAAFLRLSRSTGFAVAPVPDGAGVAAVLFADHGPGGPDVLREEALELEGLAAQATLVWKSARVGA